MATAVLRTEGCLRHRFRRKTFNLDCPFRCRRDPNPRLIKRNNRKGPLGFQSNNRRQAEPMVVKSPAKNLVMGQVKILKRGETLITDSEKKTDLGTIDDEIDLALGSTSRLGPDPETMQKQVKVKEFKIGGSYAGSCSFVSPSPSSLPVPVFWEESLRHRRDCCIRHEKAGFGITFIAESGSCYWISNSCVVCLSQEEEC